MYNDTKTSKSRMGEYKMKKDKGMAKMNGVMHKALENKKESKSFGTTKKFTKTDEDLKDKEKDQ